MREYRLVKRCKEMEMEPSEELRTALHAAERVLRLVISLTDSELLGDQVAERQLREALGTVMDCRRSLELGTWAGRTVVPYPFSTDRWPSEF